MLVQAPIDDDVYQSTMKQKQALKLREGWGDAPCDHPALAREYDADGMRTSSYICTQCGRILTFQQRAELMQARGERT